MPVLKELHVGIDDAWWVRTLDVEEAWVQPMKAVKGLEVFELEIVRPSNNPYWEKAQVDAFAGELRGALCVARK